MLTTKGPTRPYDVKIVYSLPNGRSYRKTVKVMASTWDLAVELGLRSVRAGRTKLPDDALVRAVKLADPSRAHRLVKEAA